MNINYEELCPVTQEQIAQIVEQEDHIETSGTNAVTEIKTGVGRPVSISEVPPETLKEVNGSAMHFNSIRTSRTSITKPLLEQLVETLALLKTWLRGSNRSSYPNQFEINPLEQKVSYLLPP